MKRKIALVLAAVFVVGLIFAYMANQPAKADEVQDKTYQILTEKGFEPVQACAIMATIKLHSNFDPTATAPDGSGYGLMQWVGVRYENLEKFAKEIGKPIEDTETQLMFIMEELDHYWINSDKAYAWDYFLEAETPGDAAKIFCQAYTATLNMNLEMTDNWAEEFYEQYTS